MNAAFHEPSICIGCGLCCDGSLHARATVRPGDEAEVTAAGLEVGTDGAKRFFRQPCPNFACGSCTVYDVRPPVCRTYRCALLERLEAGSISRAEAMETIVAAKQFLAKVRQIDRTAITPADRTALAARLKQGLISDSEVERQEAAKGVLAIGVLEHFLNRWFMKEKKTGQANK